MKKSVWLFIGMLFACTWLHAQEVLPRPNPPRLVTDQAGVLSEGERQALEQKLVALDDSSSNQIAVVLIKTLNDRPVEEYATKLFREWGIGNKKTNNGVLILAAIDDRKVWIEVGYGLEGAIPDITASEIYRNLIVPAFKRKNYFEGLDNAVDALAKAAVGEYKVARKKNSSKPGGGGSIITFLVILVIVLLFVGGGGFGGGGGRRRRSGLDGLAEGLLLGSLLNGGSNRGGWGGGFGGGGFGGGGGGGGFGGFGGGRSGGGGAGGGW
jgi:uncharacterized protein